MSKYRIQTCKSRSWYVEDYLVPSLLAQGIVESDIRVWLDENEDGNLLSCMKSFYATDGDDDEITWYLQDDVIICSDFKVRTESFDNIVVCGFCSNYMHYIDLKEGLCETKHMWYSFPCIGIPNRVANGCAHWFFNFVIKNTGYNVYVNSRKMDDTLFWIYMQDFSKETSVINCVPNLVDHIDYLIGGSVANKIRERKIVRSSYWEEPELVNELERRLKDEGRGIFRK